jgi:hypothetical protein
MISDSDEDDVAVTDKYVKNNDTLKGLGWAGMRQYETSKKLRSLNLAVQERG